MMFLFQSVQVSIENDLLVVLYYLPPSQNIYYQAISLVLTKIPYEQVRTSINYFNPPTQLLSNDNPKNFNYIPASRSNS